MSLNVISLPPVNGTPTYLFVALHGWGANAQDLAPLAPFFQIPNCQYLFPDAPFNHPSFPGGKAWYSLETPHYEGLQQSRELLTNWLKSLEAESGVPLSRTFLSGFSQGGAMTLDVGLTLPLAGLCSLSGYLHSEPQSSDAPFPPVLIAHGKQDQVVPLQAAHQARDALVALNVNVEYHEFEMGHEIQPTELTAMQQFLQKVIEY